MQGVLSIFLQKCLPSIRLPGFISFKNSDGEVSRLAEYHHKSMGCALLDIKDLYYTLGQELLLKRVTDVLELNAADFQTKVGMSIDTMLEMLRQHLGPAVVHFNWGFMIQ